LKRVQAAVNDAIAALDGSRARREGPAGRRSAAARPHSGARRTRSGGRRGPHRVATWLRMPGAVPGRGSMESGPTPPLWGIPRPCSGAGGRGSWSGKAGLSHFVAPDRIPGRLREALGRRAVRRQRIRTDRPRNGHGIGRSRGRSLGWSWRAGSRTRAGCRLPDGRHRHAALVHDDPVLLVNLPTGTLDAQSGRPAHVDGNAQLFGQLATRDAAGRHLTTSNVPYPGVEFGQGLARLLPRPARCGRILPGGFDGAP